MNKRTGPPAKALETVEEAKAFVESATSVSVIGFFKVCVFFFFRKRFYYDLTVFCICLIAPFKLFCQDQTSDAAKVFLAVAGMIDDYPFGITSSDDVFAEYKVEDGKVVLFKKVGCLIVSLSTNLKFYLKDN